MSNATLKNLTGRKRGLEIHRAFLEQTRCPLSAVEHLDCMDATGPEVFFQLGALRLYGGTNGSQELHRSAGEAAPIDSQILRRNGTAVLPFNPTQIFDNLRLEKYVSAANPKGSYTTDSKSFSRRMYYALRPLFPVPVRRIFQRIALQDWSKLPFPAWPVDTTVEDFVNWLWVIALETTGAEKLPFIWYWPDAFHSCAIMTHDVETGEGQEFCRRILELEQEFGIKSAFELVPEVRYKVSASVLDAIRQAGSEVCVHGLNHDGRLFTSEELFRTRAKAINQYARSWGATGFRSPVMYRNLNWYDAFEFSYDMSVPNVAHLDPQRGGCCTIFPYFVGDVVELPLTTIQDYPLYNILRSDPMAMWTRQIELIHSRHGLSSFIIHPDYTFSKKRQNIYRELLRTLRKYGDERKMWLALPGEVDQWWRERAAMTLVQEGGEWVVQGKGSRRAVVAYVTQQNGRINYTIPNRSTATFSHAQ